MKWWWGVLHFLIQYSWWEIQDFHCAPMKQHQPWSHIEYGMLDKTRSQAWALPHACCSICVTFFFKWKFFSPPGMHSTLHSKQMHFCFLVKVEGSLKPWNCGSPEEVPQFCLFVVLVNGDRSTNCSLCSLCTVIAGGLSNNSPLYAFVLKKQVYFHSSTCD